MITLEGVLDLFTKFVIGGGGAWLVWGAIVLAGGLKDTTGPQIQAGIWQVIGGLMIIAAAGMFAQIQI